MSTKFPGAQDDNSTLPNPTSNSPTTNPSHAQLHTNTNDAIKAIEVAVLANTSVLIAKADKTYVDGLNATLTTLINTKASISSLATVATSGLYSDLSGKPDLSGFDNFDTFANLAGFPATGVGDRFYLALDSGLLYRWTGSAYVQTTSVVSDATTSAKGIIQLASDLYGTAAAPRVFGLPTPTTRIASAISANGAVTSNIPLTTGTGSYFPNAGRGVGSNTKGLALKFTGPDYVNIADATLLHFATSSTPFSIFQRIYLDAAFDASITRNVSATVGRFVVQIGTDKRLRGNVWGGTTMQSVSPLALSTWYDALFTYDGTNASLYLNGVLQQTGTTVTTAGGSSPLQIGHKSDQGNVGFMGLIDDVVIWNRAITSTEAVNATDGLFAASGQILNMPVENEVGTIVSDVSGSGNVGTITGATWARYSINNYYVNLWDDSTFRYSNQDSNVDRVLVVGKTGDNLRVVSPVNSHAVSQRVEYAVIKNIDNLIPGQTPIPQGGTGASTVAGARANLFLETRASVSVGVAGSGADFECTGVNDDLQVQAAINLANSTNRYVQLLGGTFNWYNQVNAQFDNVHIKGLGRGITTIKNMMTNSNSMLIIGSTSGPTVVKNSIFEGITVDLGNTTGAGFGIVLSWNDRALVRDCEFINPGVNFKSALLIGKFNGASAAWEARDYVIDNCYFDAGGVAHGAWEYVTITYARNVNVSNCVTRRQVGPQPGMLCYNSENLNVVNSYFFQAQLSLGGRGPSNVVGCNFESAQAFVFTANNVTIDGCGFNGTVADGMGSQGSGIIVTGGYLVSGGETPFYITTTPYVWNCTNIVISNNKFNGCNSNAINSRTINVSGTTVVSANDLTIVGNTFANSYREGIYVVAQESLTITGNRFSNNNVATGASSAANARVTAPYVIVSGNKSFDTSGNVGSDFVFDATQFATYVPTMKVKMSNNFLTLAQPIAYFNNTSGSITTTPTGTITVESVEDTGVPSSIITKFTANGLDASTQKITSVANGSVASDAVNYSQLTSAPFDGGTP